ncbi:hypothetical protein IHN58_17275, partial [Deinococcus sp. 12RED42]|nr:hypothetical protein [Deinococcus sp. 12RED42]
MQPISRKRTLLTAALLGGAALAGIGLAGGADMPMPAPASTPLKATA